MDAVNTLGQVGVLRLDAVTDESHIGLLAGVCHPVEQPVAFEELHGMLLLRAATEHLRRMEGQGQKGERASVSGPRDACNLGVVGGGVGRTMVVVQAGGRH